MNRTVVGVFADSTGVASALAKLMVMPRSALPDLVLVNAAAAGHDAFRDIRAMAGPGSRYLVGHLSGDPESLGMAARAFWQAVERAGGRPMVVEHAVAESIVADSPNDTSTWPDGYRPMHEPFDQVIQITAAPIDLPALMDAVEEMGTLLGPVAAYAEPLAGRLQAVLPEHPERAAALAWLAGEVPNLGGAVDPGPTFGDRVVTGA